MAKKEEKKQEDNKEKDNKEKTNTKKDNTTKEQTKRKTSDEVEGEVIEKAESKKQKKETNNTIKKTRAEKGKTDKTKEIGQKKKTEIEEKKENKKALIVKKEIEMDEVKLERIEEEIKKQTTIPEERKKKINKRIFQNIIIAIVIVFYFIFINLGYYNLKGTKFLKDLQVFSIITIGITILILEKAYQKDSLELTIYGIESLILSICTLLTIYIRVNYYNKFSYIINMMAILFAIYYVGKSIVIYLKMRKKALKRVSDIDKIRRVK